MNKKLLLYCAAGFVFVSVVGTLLHFVYEWSGSNFLVGLFAPVNESTWEHIKLLFFPMAAFSLYAANRLNKDYPHVLSAFLAGCLAGCFLIPVLFYTYSGILGTNVTAIDIAIFYICTAAAFWIAYRLALSEQSKQFRFAAIAGAVVLCVLFFLFTYRPPRIGLFQSGTPESSNQSASLLTERK